MPPAAACAPGQLQDDRGIGMRNSYLYRHFRPEFLQLYEKLSLSPDAFSFFAASTEPEAAGS